MDLFGAFTLARVSVDHFRKENEHILANAFVVHLARYLVCCFVSLKKPVEHQGRTLARIYVNDTRYVAL